MSRLKAISLCVVALLALPAMAPAVPTIPGAPTEIPELSLQVWALRSIHEMELTPAQLKAFRAAAAPDTASRMGGAKSKVSEKYVAALHALRDALLKGDDDDRITELRDDLETMHEDDEIDVNDDIAITANARTRTPDLLKMLAPSQVAGYIAVYQDEIPDPQVLLRVAIEEVRGAEDDDFKSTLDDTTDEVSVLLAGLDIEKAKPITEQIRAMLKHARDMNDSDFKSKRGDLEADGRKIIGDVGPVTVLQHWLERDIAELLSNPQLTSAIDAKSR